VLAGLLVTGHAFEETSVSEPVASEVRVKS